uniref:C-type lectin domain-containing protein n=1 Tax=Laticauda laticaudata TaxID=8630 RepID=A0A8C5WRV9_LATLA
MDSAFWLQTNPYLCSPVTKLGSKTQIPHYLNLYTFALVVYPVLLQNFLQTRARNARHWLGLTDIDIEGEWKWVDGSSYRNGFRYWKRGEPNNDLSNEDCAHLWGNGEWNDVFCTYSCYYICEKPLPRIF